MELKQALRMGSQPTNADDRMAVCENVLMRELIAMLVIPGYALAKHVTHAHHEKFVDRIRSMTEWELVSTVGTSLCEFVSVDASDGWGMSEGVWDACHGDCDLADAAASQVWDALLRIRETEGYYVIG